jgi:hypothetical protein
MEWPIKVIAMMVIDRATPVGINHHIQALR